MNVDLYKEKLDPVIKRIVSSLDVKRIYLLGAVSTGVLTSNIFIDGIRPMLDVRELQLFIVTSDTEKRTSEVLHDLVELKCGHLLPVTPIVIPARVFTQWLRKGHTMAQKVYQANTLVYEDSKTEVIQPPDYLTDDYQRRNMREHLTWSSRANELFLAVDLFRSRRQFTLGAFLLYQAAELAYMAVIRLVTGYRAGTHNLDRMVRYAVPFCGAKLNVFPRNNEQERKWFNQLQKAYIHGRYKDDFEISEGDFLMLLERVKTLMINVRDYSNA